MTSDELLKTLAQNGLETPDKLTAFLQLANKPLKRASIQDVIDQERKQFLDATNKHNTTLADLQSQLEQV